jgi:hypothetical protein
MAFYMYGFNCKLLSTQAAVKKNLFLHDVLEITNGQPWQNSVFWIGAECHCRRKSTARWLADRQQIQRQVAN